MKEIAIPVTAMVGSAFLALSPLQAIGVISAFGATALGLHFSLSLTKK